ncbi:MAG TPA: GGDEF domain-containing protein [Thermomicrobiales bacterium]|nr:GGDEF domain-containing protein [Thermomicrobiales bacterium]
MHLRLAPMQTAREWRFTIDRSRRITSLFGLAGAVVALGLLAQEHRWLVAGGLILLGLISAIVAGRWGGEVAERTPMRRVYALEAMIAYAGVSALILLQILRTSSDQTRIGSLLVLGVTVALVLWSVAIDPVAGMFVHLIGRALVFVALALVAVWVIDRPLTAEGALLLAALPPLLSHLSLATDWVQATARLTIVSMIAIRLLADGTPLVLLLVLGAIAAVVDLEGTAAREEEAFALPRGQIAPLIVIGVLICAVLGALTQIEHLALFLGASAVSLGAVGAVGGWRVYAVQMAHLDATEHDLSVLRAIADLDDLTGLPRRGALRRRLDEEVERAIRYRQPMCVCFVDIDHFKRVNDTWGHQAGDQVLLQVGQTIRNTLRTPDFVARYGGEEFVVIAPGTWSEDARVLGTRVQQALAGVEYGLPIDVTVSIGIASVPEHGTTADIVLARADHALYVAKFTGRNRVEVATISDTVTS